MADFEVTSSPFSSHSSTKSRNSDEEELSHEELVEALSDVCSRLKLVIKEKRSLQKSLKSILFEKKICKKNYQKLFQIKRLLKKNLRKRSVNVLLNLINKRSFQNQLLKMII